MARLPSEVLLSRRERQIMDIVYAAGRATGSEIQKQLPDELSYSTVRTLLRILEGKGYLRHVEEGLRYVYEPAVPRETARKSALKRILRTFFDDSAQQAVAALLDPKSFHLSPKELDELSALIEKARNDSLKKEQS
ncbi:MAG: BlaI/MecI/CopY family transcriptional regulator [Bryobacteraceae bacterium]